MERKKQVIDCEPRWVGLVPILVDMGQTKSRDYAISELTKIAKIADEVRQAQKKKEKLVYDFTDKRDTRR